MDESTRFVCVGCGNEGPRPPGFTQMDDRYAVGFCNVCTDSKPRKTARPKSQFIRADLFDHARWVEQRERATLKKHVMSVGAPGGLRLMSDRAIWESVTFFDKYGYPGWEPNAETRTFANDYAHAADNRKLKTRTKDKRGRGA